MPVPHNQIRSAIVQRGGSALRIILFAMVALACYSLFLSTHQADFAESNFQGNLARIQKYLFGPRQDVVLVGSSISGRLLPRYFSDSGFRVANLGMDGSGVDFALEIARQRLDRPPVIMVETYSFFRKSDMNDMSLQEAVHSFSFHAARYFPPMRSDSRPSSFLYSLLKRQSDRREGITTLPAPFEEKNHKANVLPVPPRDRASELRLKGIQQDFNKVFFVRIPTGGDIIPRPSDQIDQLSLEVGIPQIDVARARLPLSYTDGRHLNSSSAQIVSHFITQRLKESALTKP